MVVRYAKWESEILGFPCAKIDKYEEFKNYQFVSARVDIYDLPSINDLIANRFEIVDILLHFSKHPMSDPIQFNDISEPHKDETDLLVDIAKRNLKLRYHYDRHLTLLECNDLLESWVRNSLEEYFTGDNYALVVYADGGPRGFVTCKIKDSDGIIDLIVVDADYSNRGFGGKLLNSALDFLYQYPVKTVKVATHANNLSAIKLYESKDFRLEKVQIDLHWWKK